VVGDEVEDFWALRDVTFQLRRGDRLGIIGRNGAGKSTLLRILSRITDPSAGEAWIRGRVSSLLEVGTGFHPDLTGRENVFLNGAILGMRRAEILRRFDEIVAFAEIEKFLDTPVKRYSSGMYVRLAFAVAAHLDPEILIVDEVLSVGDAQFQEKCLGKMSQVAGEGRTVLFVSHNLAAVRSLCTHGLLLRDGRLAASGPVDEVARTYLEEGERNARGATVPLTRPRPDIPTWMESVTTLRNGEPSAVLETGDRLGFEVRFRSAESLEKPIVGYLIRSVRGENAVNANNYFLPSPAYGTAVPEGTVVCDLGALPLMSGTYLVSFWFGRSPHDQHHVEDVLRFTVEERDVWHTGALPTRGLSCLWWPTDFRLLGAGTGTEGGTAGARARVGP
jgi:lipopolysaccharide transport system ATP-binding protein